MEIGELWRTMDIDIYEIVSIKIVFIGFVRNIGVETSAWPEPQHVSLEVTIWWKPTIVFIPIHRISKHSAQHPVHMIILCRVLWSPTFECKNGIHNIAKRRNHCKSEIAAKKGKELNIGRNKSTVSTYKCNKCKVCATIRIINNYKIDEIWLWRYSYAWRISYFTTIKLNINEGHHRNSIHSFHKISNFYPLILIKCNSVC